MKFIDFDNIRFIKQRQEIFKLIDDELKIDGHHKSYEGTLSINFNNRFKYDDSNPEIYIYLSCYVAPIGGRGDSFDSQDKLDEFINYWKNEIQERLSE